MQLRILSTYLILGLSLGACAYNQKQTVTDDVAPVPENNQASMKPAAGGKSSAEDNALTITAEADSPQSSPAARSKIYRGTGRFINYSAAKKPAVTRLKSGDLTLNFENADIREVAEVILGKLLNENYVVDPAVAGTVSLQTSRGIAEESLLYVLESLLHVNGAALVQEGELYRITPIDSASLNTLQPHMLNQSKQRQPGFRIQIVPMRYIAAREMETILTPMVRKGGILRVDERRNLLLLAGTSLELQSWLQTVEIFDVDWLKGQSVGIFPLEYAQAAVVTQELLKILGSQGDSTLADMVRAEPLERLNAVMIISPQAHYVDEMQRWIKRLDNVGSEPGVRLFVYKVKNRKAGELATIVQNIFSETNNSSEPPYNPGQEYAKPVSLAPELKPVTLESANKETVQQANVAAPAGNADLSVPNGSSVRIVADESNNAILVLASAADYKSIEAALNKLDMRPLQVLIEASIVEITLTDDFRFGLEWFFKNNNVIDNNKLGLGSLDLGAGAGIGAVIPGFSYSVIDSTGVVRGVLNTLASESKLKVLSSPSLMVLDNRTASIRIGDQQPVRTSTSTTDGGVITEAIEFKDTGVLLTVTPQVHSGGLVTMDISQEVTDVGNIDSATGQRSFLQRNISSTVAIQDGETIVLGGLITENKSVSESGIPVLYKIPILGKLFGQTSTADLRRELVVLITPKVVENNHKAIAITNEFQQRLQNLQLQNRIEKKKLEVNPEL